MKVFWTLAFLCVSLASSEPAPDRGKPWPRHVIDASSRGADGVRLADANGDGLLDIATGWEEGGITCVYLHPGYERAQEPWPAVTVGKTRSVEDAVLVDLDDDGALDVVSCCEGRERSVFVHWAPPDGNSYLDATQWRTEPFPALRGKQQFMFALPMQVDGRRGIDLVVGAKNAGAQVGWLESPANPRRLADWVWHPLRPAGWIMSLLAADMDGDGDQDIVISDRKGPRRGCFWLENPAPKTILDSTWEEHRIGHTDDEMMFLTLGDLDGDGSEDVLCPTRFHGLRVMHRLDAAGRRWRTETLPMPPNCGSGKAVTVCDIDLDGDSDIALSLALAQNKSGIVWLEKGDGDWTAHEISGPEGVKYDLLPAVDMDGDGDPDLVTTEERTPLGVVWYENPTRPR